MKNRLEVESAILELEDLKVVTVMLRNNPETINSQKDLESLCAVMADAFISKVDKLYAAFYGDNM